MAINHNQFRRLSFQCFETVSFSPAKPIHTYYPNLVKTGHFDFCMNLRFLIKKVTTFGSNKINALSEASITIYKCFVGSPLNYGCIVYDQALTVLFTKKINLYNKTQL